MNEDPDYEEKLCDNTESSYAYASIRNSDCVHRKLRYARPLNAYCQRQCPALVLRPGCQQGAPSSRPLKH